MLLLALSMTAGAGGRAIAAPARSAGPRPTRRRAISSSPACGDSCSAAAAMPASVPSAPVQAPVPAEAATGCVYDRLWSALRPWDDAKNRGYKLKWQSGIRIAW